ncbi:MAG: sigma-70 family RNA polymerase sigma factor [Planctomycetes bacterium]|nr:sigma-70 family RNA polymerase sigma factor [Planctomycetota bacterium]
MTSDADLMMQFQKGEREAFEKLVMRHQVGIFNFFYRLVGNRELAEDQTQEVFFRLYTHAESYTNSAKFTTYMYRIAKNCWIDHMRRVKRRGRMQSLDKETENGLNLYDNLSAQTEEPHENLEREDKRNMIDEALASLPEEQRVVFVLSEIQGMKYAEISETLDIPVGTIKSRMHVAVSRLREYLTRHGITGKE